MHVHRFKQFLQRTSPLITLALLAALLVSVVPPWLALADDPAPIMTVEGNRKLIDNDSTEPTFDNFTLLGNANTGTGVTRTFTIKNARNAGTLTLNEVTISGDDVSDFSVTQPKDLVVEQNRNTTFTITFKPTTLAGDEERNATVSIANDDPDKNPYTFAIQGIAGIPNMGVQGNNANINNNSTAPSLNNHTEFGNVKVGNTLVRTFTIRNTGVNPLKLTGTPVVEITGPNASEFTVTQDPGSITLEQGQNTTFSVTFEPTAAGVRTATVSIANNEVAKNPYTFAIQGTGGVPEIEVLGNNIVIVNNADPLETNDTIFPGTDVSQTSERTFTIKNVGDDPLVLTGTAPNFVTRSGSNTFSVKNQPAKTTLAKDETTTFTIEFKPTSAATFNATFSILNNHVERSPYQIKVRGQGTGPEMLVQGGDPLRNISRGNTRPAANIGTLFDDTAVSASSTRTFTIKNTGTQPLELTLPITIDGDHASNFKVTTPPTTPIAPGADTPFVVTFTPTAEGERNATVSVASNEPLSPYTFAIRGFGGENPFSPPAIDGPDPRVATVVQGQSLTLPFEVKDPQEGDSFEWEIDPEAEPANGEATFENDMNTGTSVNVIYTPAEGYTGSDSFKVLLTGKGGTASVTVAVVVSETEPTPTPTATPTPPVVPTTTPTPMATPTMTPTATPRPSLEITITIQGGQGSLGSIKIKFEENDIVLVKVKIVGLPEKGRLVVQQAGLMNDLEVGDEIDAADLDNLVYIPNPGASGTDSFTLLGIDEDGIEYPMNVDLTIAPPTVYLPIIVR